MSNKSPPSLQAYFESRLGATRKLAQEDNDAYAEAIAKRLKERLIAAEQKRKENIGKVREKAAARIQKIAHAAADIAAQQEQFRRSVEQKLATSQHAASVAREQRLRAVSRRAAEHTQRTKIAAQRLKQREEEELSRKQAALVARLENAEKRRKQLVEAQHSHSSSFTSSSTEKTISSSSAVKIQKAWRQFASEHKPTSRLVSDFLELSIAPTLPPEQSKYVPDQPFHPVHQDTFDSLADLLNAPSTLKRTSALLSRIQFKATSMGVLTSGSEPLLRRLFPLTSNKSPPKKLAAVKPAVDIRYPPRVFLCSYVIISHQEIVFNGHSGREEPLVATAHEMLAAFDNLLQHFTTTTAAVNDALVQPSSSSLKELVKNFDERWVAYLEQFVAWKSADLAGIERDLIRMAVELETSKLSKAISFQNNQISTTENSSGSGSIAYQTPYHRRSEEDIRSIIQHVDQDIELIRERVLRLTGASGSHRLEAALAAARAASLNVSSSSINNINNNKAMTNSFLEPAHQEQAIQAIDVAAVLSSPEAQNLPVAWQLLYDTQFRIPTEEVMMLWRDALGETDPLRANKEESGDGDGGDSAQTVSVGLRVRRIAERAFWDSIAAKLAELSSSSANNSSDNTTEKQQESSALYDQLADILTSLGKSILEVVPVDLSISQEVASTLSSKDDIVNALKSSHSSTNTAATAVRLLPGLNTEYLFHLLEWSAQLLRRLGSPARDEDADRARQLMQSRLTTLINSQTDTISSRQEAAKIIASMLRLLTVQLTLLRVDLANTRLDLLLRTLRGADNASVDGIVDHVVRKFKILFGDPGSIGADDDNSTTTEEYWASRLPHTRAFLAVASGHLVAAEHLQQNCPGLHNTITTATDSGRILRTPPPSVPSVLRTGLRATNQTATTSTLQQQQQPDVGNNAAVWLSTPVAAQTWNGLLRCAFADFISQTLTASSPLLLQPKSPSLPETLALDASRLHEAANEFQKIVVTAVCINLALENNNHSSETVGVIPVVDVNELKRRLTILLADPEVGLAELATEISIHSSSSSSLADHDSVLAEKLKAAVSRTSPALKSIATGLNQAIVLLLLCGINTANAKTGASTATVVRQHDAAVWAERQVVSLLRECGCNEVLLDDLRQLANKLGVMCAVHEAVFEKWYKPLTVRLL